MDPIRVRTTASADGELHLRGLPIRKGEQAEGIVFPDEINSDAFLSVLAHDPTWDWFRDPAEDVYSEEDIR